VSPFQPSVQCVPGARSLGGKAVGAWIWPLPASAEVKKVLIYTCTPHTHAHTYTYAHVFVAWRGVEWRCVTWRDVTWLVGREVCGQFYLFCILHPYLRYAPNLSCLDLPLPTSADRGCRVISAAGPHGRKSRPPRREPLLLQSSSSSVILCRPTTSEKIW
jgi:hypothetical protein